MEGNRVMGYAVYEDRHALDYGVIRWAGYGVPAICDNPSCDIEINRGFSYLCGESPMDDNPGEHRGGDCMGCGLYFCPGHRYGDHQNFEPKGDTNDWVEWILTDDSWEQWRSEHPKRVEEMKGHIDN